MGNRRVKWWTRYPLCNVKLLDLQSSYFIWILTFCLGFSHQPMLYFLKRLKQAVCPEFHNTSCAQVRLRINSSDDCSERHWRNVVLERMCQSISDDEGGVQVCIREALGHLREIDRTLPKVCAATKNPCLNNYISNFVRHLLLFFSF